MLFSFHSEEATLTAWGKFCSHQFVLVMCFALNAVCSSNIMRIIIGCIISLLISWGALYCIRFTHLGYGTLLQFPQNAFSLRANVAELCFKLHAWRKKKERKNSCSSFRWQYLICKTCVKLLVMFACCDYSSLYDYFIKTPPASSEKKIINIRKLVTEYLTIIINWQTNLLLTVINSGSSLYNRLIVLQTWHVCLQYGAHPKFFTLF